MSTATRRTRRSKTSVAVATSTVTASSTRSFAIGVNQGVTTKYRPGVMPSGSASRGASILSIALPDFPTTSVVGRVSTTVYVPPRLVGILLLHDRGLNRRKQV